MFDRCLVDGLSREDIIKRFPMRENGAYYLDKFVNHLRSHGLTLQEYCETYLNIIWPTCPTKKIKTGYKLSGKGVSISRYSKGGINKKVCRNFAIGCNKLSNDRLGSNNPMFGATPWNKGLDKEDPRVAAIALKNTGKKVSEKTRKKQSFIRSKHPLKARHVTKHSKESKQKMRDATIKRWESGLFSFRETSIEKRVKIELERLNINFVQNHQIGSNFVCDFYLPDYNIIIECQGDFFHCNPNSKYKTPTYPVQFRNTYRDNKKREYYSQNGFFLLELWESEINSGEFKESLWQNLKK